MKKIKPNTSIIYHFIINTNKWYGHPPLSPLSSMTFDNVEFYYVWQRHCFIIKLNLTLNTIHFLAQYTGVNYRLKQSCLHLTNCWFDRQCFTGKKSVSLNHVTRIRLTEFSRYVTCQRNAMINRNANRHWTYISSLSKYMYVMPLNTSYLDIFNFSLFLLCIFSN